jgi:hypothetical protein
MEKNLSDSNARLKNAAKNNPNSAPKVQQARQTAETVKANNSKEPYTGNSEDRLTDKKAKEATRSLRGPSKPSFEGYMGSSSAHVQFNKSGYDNPKHQQARNETLSGQRNPNISPASFNKQTHSFNKNGIIINHARIPMGETSRTSIDKILKINNYFN